MAPHSDWITALRLFELARTCAKQARRARTKAAKDQLKRMVDEYLERAAKLVPLAEITQMPAAEQT